MLTSEKVRSLHNKVSVGGAKLLQHTEGGIVFAVDDIADEIVQLEGESKMLHLMMAADISAFVELTEKVHEHPENYEHICLCELCRSYGD